jgi:hypothetical protein
MRRGARKNSRAHWVAIVGGEFLAGTVKTIRRRLFIWPVSFDSFDGASANSLCPYTGGALTPTESNHPSQRRPHFFQSSSGKVHRSWSDTLAHGLQGDIHVSNVDCAVSALTRED